MLCLGQFMIALDGSIVNVALPTIQRELHFTQANLTWVVNAYLIRLKPTWPWSMKREVLRCCTPT